MPAEFHKAHLMWWFTSWICFFIFRIMSVRGIEGCSNLATKKDLFLLLQLIRIVILRHWQIGNIAT